MPLLRLVIVAVLALLPATATLAADGTTYLTGLKDPEDLVAIPGTRWIIASSMREGDQGGVPSLIDRDKMTLVPLFPKGPIANKYDARAYPGCPGLPDAHALSSHGINLRKGRNGVHTLYVVSHTPREAVEVFEVNAAGAVPAIAWKGCVLLPQGSYGNSVAPLPDGIAVTVMAAPEYFAQPGDAIRSEAWIAKFRLQETTGYVARWTAAKGWKMMFATEASGPNGLEASADGRWLWVANWANNTIVRLPLKDGDTRAVWRVNFLPDNLRLGDDGKLWAAGHAGLARDFFACQTTAGCKADYAIAVFDPAINTWTIVPHPDTGADFTSATVALRVGKDVWLGSYMGERIAVMRLGN